jgi:hypothetical protein
MLFFLGQIQQKLIEKLNDKNSPKFHESLVELLKKCHPYK